MKFFLNKWLFLVGVSKKMRCFYSANFFVSLTLNGPLFVDTVHFYPKHSILDSERIQSLYHEIQNHSTAERSPFPILRHYETFPAPFSALYFFENFEMSSKGPPSIFRHFAREWLLVKPEPHV